MSRSTMSLLLAAAVVAIQATCRAFALFGDPLPAIAPVAIWTPRASPQMEHPVPVQTATPVRPLFSRPDVSNEANDAQSGAAKGRASEGASLPRLVGVVAEGDRRIAVISHQGALIRAREKSRVGEWTVARIEPRSALLRTATKSEMLWLDPTKAKDAELIPGSQ